MEPSRRAFFKQFAVATAGAVATLAIDPEQLVWVPGKKTIIDLGATKQIVPATDAEVVAQAKSTFELFPDFHVSHAQQQYLDNYANRDITLYISSNGLEGKFKFKGDRLIGEYSDEDYKLLNRPVPGYVLWRDRR
jgi:hypothetical protein